MNKDSLVSTKIEGKFAQLFLGNPEDKAIILTEERMLSLKRELENLTSLLKNNQSILAVVISSPPSLGFCLGADINAIKDVTKKDEGERLAKQGQSIFQLIEDLPIPTIAAIHGPCVGGGCELVLACDYRIISNDPSSKIGLPETKLGILPGFGGTQRLPRLIGLPKALDIILQGKIVDGKKAKKIGLVDDFFNLTTEDEFLSNIIQKAEQLYKKGKRSSYNLPLVDCFLSRTKLGRTITTSKASKESYKKTKGKYPAIEKAIFCSSLSSVGNASLGYKQEAEALGELIISPESKALVHVFFLTENAQKIAKKNPLEKVGSIGIIGAGVMGRGLAAVSLKSGLKTTVADPIEQSRENAKKHILEFINSSKSLSNEKKVEKISNLEICSDSRELKNPEIIVEAIIEDLDIKRKLFTSLEDQYPKETILASNTSSLKLAEIFSNNKYKDRLIGIHFFNPVEKMPLVEIIRTKETSDQTLIRAISYVSKLGKYPVVVEDVPGFLVNRILCPYLSEASRILALGVPLMNIERVINKFGFPMGPFRLIDEVGLDVGRKVQTVLTEAYGDRMRGSGILGKLIEVGMLGKKNGKGFYLYEGDKPLPNMALKDFGITITGTSPLSDQEILDRLLGVMMSEAKLCLDEGVAGSPSVEASYQIDLASIMGFGFPAFLGGILYHASKKP